MAFHSSFRGSVPRTPPVFTQASPPDGVVSAPYSYQFVAAGALRYAIASGALPAGTTLNTANGVVSGTPTTVATYNFAVSATNVFSTVTTPTETVNVTTGVPPTYVGTGAVEPGFVAGTRGVGIPLPIDFGLALNNPTGYDVQMYRLGVAIGALASNVTSFSYTPVSADSGTMLSASVVPRNSAGPGPAVFIAGVSIP